MISYEEFKKTKRLKQFTRRIDIENYQTVKSLLDDIDEKYPTSTLEDMTISWVEFPYEGNSDPYIVVKYYETDEEFEKIVQTSYQKYLYRNRFKE